MRTHALLLAAVACAAAFAVTATAAPEQHAAARPFTGKLTYKETNPGKNVGDATKGVVGQGVFSGKLSGAERILAALVQRVSGVPAAALAKGGTWVARYDIDAKNDYKGLVVATFKSPGLGSVCLQGTTKHGKYVSGFIPASGTLTTLGGTGQAAQLRLSVAFKQTAITGSDTETFSGTGSFKTLSMGPAKPMTAACKAVAKLKS